MNQKRVSARWSLPYGLHHVMRRASSMLLLLSLLSKSVKSSGAHSARTFMCSWTRGVPLPATGVLVMPCQLRPARRLCIGVKRGGGHGSLVFGGPRLYVHSMYTVPVSASQAESTNVRVRQKQSESRSLSDISQSVPQTAQRQAIEGDPPCS